MWSRVEAIAMATVFVVFSGSFEGKLCYSVCNHVCNAFVR